MMRWMAFALGVLVVVAACGGGNGVTVSGPGAGSVLCGANGTNGCGNRKCDAALGCVDCLANTDCPASGPICVRGSCGQCGTNADCPASTPACWPSDHTCHPACTANSSCPKDSQICDTTSGACVG